MKKPKGQRRLRKARKMIDEGRMFADISEGKVVVKINHVGSDLWRDYPKNNNPLTNMQAYLAAVPHFFMDAVGADIEVFLTDIQLREAWQLGEGDDLHERVRHIVAQAKKVYPGQFGVMLRDDEETGQTICTLRFGPSLQKKLLLYWETLTWRSDGAFTMRNP